MHLNKLILPALLGAVAASVAAAADQQAPQQTGSLYNVTRVVVKADHVGTYRDYLKKLSDGYKKAGVQSFHVYVGLSGNPLEYMMVRSVPNYAALDDGPILSKAFGETERVRLNVQRDQCTESVQVAYERGVLAIGGGEPRAYRVVTRFRARPGMADAYTNALKAELQPPLSKLDGLRYRVRRVEWGGSRNEFVMTSDIDKMSALDKPSPMVQAMGPEGAAAWTKRVADFGAQVDASVYRHLPEFGFTVRSNYYSPVRIT